jgi:hypothetical protein
MDNETGIKRKIGVRFSKIVVIQSLKSNDMKTLRQWKSGMPGA